MSVVLKFTVDNSEVVHKLNEIKGQMGKLNWSDFAMGVDAVLGLMGKVKSAISTLMAPAAALEDMGAKLGVMLNSSAGGEALASSLERLATNGVVPLQDLQAAASALIGTFSDPSVISQWVRVFADIAAGTRIPAARLAEMTSRMEDMGKAELTELANAGIPIFQTLATVTGKNTEELIKMSAEGKISSDTLLEAFRAMTEEGQKFHDLNATMSNTTAGSWATLAASWQEILAAVGESLNNVLRPAMQELSAFLQEHKEALASLVKLVVQLSTAWAAAKFSRMIGGMTLKLWDTVKAMKAAVVEAKALSAAMSFSRGGLLSLAVGGVAFGASYVYNRSQELKAQEEEEERRRRESWAEVNRRDAEKEAAAHAAEIAENEKIWGELNQAELEQAKALMSAAKTVEEFEDALKKAKENGLGTKKDLFVNGGFDVSAAYNAAYRREMSASLADKEKERFTREKAEKEAKRRAAFSELSAADMRSALSGFFSDYQLGSLPDSPLLMSDRINTGLHMAAREGDVARYDMLERIQKRVDAYVARLEKDAAASEVEKKEKEKLANSRSSALSEIRSTAQRDTIALSGDAAALAAFDDEQERHKLSAQFQAAGLSSQEADWYAGQQVKRARMLKNQEPSDESGQGVQLIAQSSVAAGMGGRSIRLGDAQLSVSRKQLGTLESIRELVGSISTRTTGIPVVI